jgi:hypothetical protein
MIIYNQKTIDHLFSKNIIPLDISKLNDLAKKLLNMKNNNKLYKISVKNNFAFYKKKFSNLEDYYNNLLFN